ncbi:MAG: sensor histidine kinase [Sphaerochaetaceae bacterium]
MARHTLKRQILFISTIVMALVALCVGFLVGFSYKRYAFKGRIASTQFNLQLVSALTASDMRNITEARRRIRQDSAIAAWLEKPEDSMTMLDAFDTLTGIFAENRSQEHFYRMLIVDKNRTNLIQVGAQMVESKKVSVDNIEELFTPEEAGRPFCDIRNDPFLSSGLGQVLPVIQPLYGFESQTDGPLGYLVMEISVSFLTDRLAGYHSDEESPLYVVLGSDVYRYEKGKFVSDGTVGWEVPKDVASVTRTRLKKRMMVSTRVDGADIFLSQAVPYSSKDETVPLFLIILMVVAMLLGFWTLLTLLLNKEVREPVAAIRRKMRSVAGGDFSRDSSIEYDSEIGDIGRGINELSAQMDGLIKGRISDAKEKQRLEYRILQAQINPHFLNNTLNSIRWMATIQKASGIAEMTTALANLLRHVSKNSGQACTIEEELSLLDDYFVIQNYRYGGTIALKKEVPERFLTVRLPRFTFQPIVENAIFHGLEPKEGGGTITISAGETENGDALFTVADDGVGMDAAQVRALLERRDIGTDGMFKSIGMYNVNQRIVYMYGSKYGMSVESAPGEGTRVLILLPMSKEEAT